jgi:hypothetical protein
MKTILGAGPCLRTSMISHTASVSWQKNNPCETQPDNSYSYSNTSSIARFPDFQFSLGTLSALVSAQGKSCLLLAVLEVDRADEVTVRRGPDAGRVVSVLCLIMGDEASTTRKLTAEREVVEMPVVTQCRKQQQAGGGSAYDWATNTKVTRVEPRATYRTGAPASPLWSSRGEAQLN